jgi:hypothetical protein
MSGIFNAIPIEGRTAERRVDCWVGRRIVKDRDFDGERIRGSVCGNMLDGSSRRAILLHSKSRIKISVIEMLDRRNDWARAKGVSQACVGGYQISAN